MIGSRVNQLKNKQRGGGYEKTIVSVMKEMKWTYTDLIKTPIPSFLIITDELVKQAEEQRKRMNKNKK